MIRKAALFISLFFITSFSYGIEVDVHSISPDKTKLALAYDDQVIRLYSLTSGELIHELKAHTDDIQTLNFNSDGSKLISGDWDNQVILWDSINGKLLKEKTMNEAIMSAYFSIGDKNIVLLEDGRLLTTYTPDLSKTKARFSISANLVAAHDRRLFIGEKARTRSDQAQGVIVVDLKSNQQLLDIPENAYDDHMFFSTDNSSVIIRDYRKFHLWDIQKGTKISSFKTDVDVEYATVHPTAKNIILVYGDDTIETWNYKTGKLLKKTVLSGRNIDDIKHIAISNDGQTAAVSSWLKDNTSEVYILDLKTDEIKNTIKPMSKICFSSEFVNNNLLLHSNYPFELWDTKKNKIIHIFAKSGSKKYANMEAIIKSDFIPYTYGNGINALDISPQGNIIITGKANPISAMEIDAKGQLTTLFQNNYIQGYDARYSHSGELAAFAYHGEHLLVYSAKTGTLQAEYDLGGVPSGTRIAKFSPDDRYLAAGSDDGSLDVIDNIHKKKIKNIQFFADDKNQEKSAGVYSIAWISERKLLVGTLEKLYLVDIKNNEPEVILTSGVTALDTYSVDNKLKFVAVGIYDDNAVLLDANLEIIREIEDVVNGRIAISADGKNLIYIIASAVHIWNINNRTIKECLGPEEDIFAMTYDAKHGKIYAGGDDGKVFAWDLECHRLN